MSKITNKEMELLRALYTTKNGMHVISAAEASDFIFNATQEYILTYNRYFCNLIQVPTMRFAEVPFIRLGDGIFIELAVFEEEVAKRIVD